MCNLLCAVLFSDYHRNYLGRRFAGKCGGENNISHQLLEYTFRPVANFGMSAVPLRGERGCESQSRTSTAVLLTFEVVPPSMNQLKLPGFDAFSKNSPNDENSCESVNLPLEIEVWF